MKIICTTTLLPEVPFVGIKMRVKVPNAPAGSLDFGISSIPNQAEPFRVDWGDGCVEYVKKLVKAVHTYPCPGTYEIRIECNIKSFIICVPNDGYDVLYGPSILSFVCNAPLTETLGTNCLYGCKNMTEFDVRETSCIKLLKGVLHGCTSLHGELYFPCVNQFTGAVGEMPLEGCIGITKIHFAAKNKAVIESSEVYKADPTLGTGAAECVFDL